MFKNLSKKKVALVMLSAVLILGVIFTAVIMYQNSAADDAQEQTREQGILFVKEESKGVYMSHSAGNDGSVELTVTTEPVNAANCKFEWSMEFTNPNAEGAEYYSPDEFIKLTVSDNGKRATVSKICDLKYQIRITVKLVGNPDISASCLVDSAPRVSDFAVQIGHTASGSSNNTITIAPFTIESYDALYSETVSIPQMGWEWYSIEPQMDSFFWYIKLSDELYEKIKSYMSDMYESNQEIMITFPALEAPADNTYGFYLNYAMGEALGGLNAMDEDFVIELCNILRENDFEYDFKIGFHYASEYGDQSMDCKFKFDRSMIPVAESISLNESNIVF